MAEQFGTMLTSVGKAKIANSIGFGTKINFTKFKLGDGGGAYYNPTEQQEDLKNVVYEGVITNITTDEANSNEIIVRLAIPANVGGFMVREYGVFDDEGDMIAIAKCAETYKPALEEGSTKELAFNMVLVVSNVESIELKIDKTMIFVRKNEFDALSFETFPTKLITSISHGLKCYPKVNLMGTIYGVGVQGCGEGPCGGGDSYSIISKTVYKDKNNIEIYVPENYYLINPSLEKVDDTQYILTFKDSFKSIIINLKEVI